jgi:DNA-binding IclR family transcriptional regulator
MDQRTPVRDATQPVGVLVKTIEVLRAMADSEDPMGPTEIAQRTGLDRSAVHRILATLARDRLVDRVDTGGVYQLGLGLAALGLVAARRLDFRRSARPHMEVLFGRFGETVNLGVLDAETVLYVDMLESRHSLRMAAVIGSRDALHTTALGKSMLAHMPEERLTAFVQRATFIPRTSTTLRTPDALLRELSKVRSQGYAIDNEENEIGAYCIGAPVFGLSGDVVGAISVSVPTARIDEQRKLELIDAVAEAGRGISRAMSLSDGIE